MDRLNRQDTPAPRQPETDSAKDELLRKLGERVKELTALHRTARVLQRDDLPPAEIIPRILELIPPAWQYPEITVGRIRFGDLVWSTTAFETTEFLQKSQFVTRTGQGGSIEVCYLEPRPDADEGPFLSEERDLIESLAEMLRSYFQRKDAEDELRAAHDQLENQVRQRTAQLEEANRALRDEVEDHRKARLRIEQFQRQLRKLASELSLAEARERREIATDVHDHLGQALAFMKMRVSQFRGDTVFCGFESNLDEILTLLDQTIAYTRSLTVEISPPVLYELGLESALNWLAEQFEKQHDIRIVTDTRGSGPKVSDRVAIWLFKSAKELLTNAVKHAQCDTIRLRVSNTSDTIGITVADNGIGCDPSRLTSASPDSSTFGLFSIRERLQYIGGRMEVSSVPNEGTTIALFSPRTMEGD